MTYPLHKTGDILVIGGYGQVGRVVSTWLGERYPGRILAAGRNFENARAFSEQTSGRVRPMQLDLDNVENLRSIIEPLRLVVFCVERSQKEVARECISTGVHYVEAGATFDSLSRILALREFAKASTASVIASAGFVPGLSNVLATHLVRRLGNAARQVNIFVMLGMGDTHGVDAIRWALDNLTGAFTVQESGKPRRVASFTEPMLVRFPEDQANRKAYRIDIADQHAIIESLNVEGASTYLCLDSRFGTRTLAFAKKLGLLKAARMIPPADLARLLGYARTGSDRFALKVVATGVRGDSIDAAATGRAESYATGVVTALAAQMLYEGKIAPGVHHIEQVVHIEDLREELEAAGIRLWL